MAPPTLQTLPNLPSSAAKYPDGNYIAMDIGMARRNDFAGFDDDGFLESFRMEPQTEFHDIVLDYRARRSASDSAGTHLDFPGNALGNAPGHCSAKPTAYLDHYNN